MIAVAKVSPVTGQPRASNRVIDQLDLSVVGVDHVGLKTMCFHQFIKWLDEVTRSGQRKSLGTAGRSASCRGVLIDLYRAP